MRVALLFSVLIATGCSFSKPGMTQKVVLDVNGKQLTAQAFAQELAYRLKDQDALSAKDPTTVNLMKAKIAQEFIVQTLSEDWAKENSLVVKAEELEEQIKKIQSGYPDDLTFQQALTEEGITFKAWRDRLQNTLLQKVIVRKLSESMKEPTAKDLEDYYNEHKAEFSVHETAQIRQILVATESDATAIEEQLKHGKKMADLAKKYSISPEAPQGGMVGWLEKGVSDVFEPAFHMKAGQRSPVIKSAFGYHIFELLGRKPAHGKTFAEAKDDIKRNLMEKTQQSLYLAWLEAQTRKARVFKDQAFIDALQVETKVQ